MNRIRASRPRPGMMRQHLTCVQAAATICNAFVQGATFGSQELIFSPNQICGGSYHFDIGSGGSATLVLQTILPALLSAPEVSTVTIIGGTHNPMAPPADFIQKCYLPVLRRMGAEVSLEVERTGFMQAGGGILHAVIQPLKAWRPLDLLERGNLVRLHGSVLHAHLAESIAQRTINSALGKLGWDAGSISVIPAPSSTGPGSILMLQADYTEITELCSSVAVQGRRAESIGARAAGQLKVYLENRAPVGIHLADQLLLPMALAEQGSFSTFALSDHTLSHMALIPLFLPVRIQQTGEGSTVLVSIHSNRTS